MWLAESYRPYKTCASFFSTVKAGYSEERDRWQRSVSSLGYFFDILMWTFFSFSSSVDSQVILQIVKVSARADVVNLASKDFNSGRWDAGCFHCESNLETS